MYAIVYKTTLSMMKDGVKIFRDHTDASEKFVYNSLMKLVSGKGFTKTFSYNKSSIYSPPIIHNLNL